MRIQYLIHAPFEKLGTIENWLNKNNHVARGTHSYRGDTLPDVSQFDMLIVMGGPQSAVNLHEYPYLIKEVELVRQAISANKAVLGICLGAQLIGVALGSKAEHSPHKEIGIYPVQLTPEAETDPVFKQFPQQFDVMHWHNDMPGIPDTAVLLASSAGCPRQAFRVGDRVYGFQYHLEFTAEDLLAMISHCGEDLIPGQYVQSIQELSALDQNNLNAINQKMHKTLDYLTECISKE